MAYDGTDRKILDILQKNGRIPNTELADEISLSTSPCLRRVKRLEDQNLISGYGARVDAKKLGWSIQAFLSIKSDRTPSAEDVKTLRSELMALPQVIWAYGLTGATDILLCVLARDLDDYYQQLVMLGNLPGAKDMQTSMAVLELKPFTGVPV